MNTTIGIDLGTTKSVVGAWIDGKPVIIPDRNGRLSIPSEILIQGDIDHQEVFVGWESRTKNKYQNNSFIVYAIKRMMGKSNSDREKWWYVYPQYAISYILAELKCMAEEFLRKDISDVVIAIPAHFDINQRRATIEAAKIAGLNVINLINEATASALTYFSKNPAEQIIAVVDIGGGTTDISVINSWGDSFYKVLTVDGTATIGGIDFSNLLYTWFLKKLDEKYNIQSSHITKAIEVIITDEIELAKKELSENTISKIYIPYLQINGIFLKEEIIISQIEFEQLSHGLVDQILDLIKKVTKGHNVVSFLLLGGASNTFGIKKRIINELNVRPIKGVNIETAVAIGAIIKSASLTSKSTTLIIECLQDNYGIAVQGDVFEIFLSKDDVIPHSLTKEFITTEDNQSSLLIKVYKGNRPMVNGNTFMGSIEIKDLPPAPKGKIVLDVRFDVDSNMDISVSATIKGNQKFDVKTILKSQNVIPEELINDMCKKVSMWESKRKIREY